MAGSVVLIDHHKVGPVRAFKVLATGDIATGAIPTTSLQSLGLGDVHGKLLAVQTNPKPAATAITLANPSDAADDIIDTAAPHGFTAGQAVRFKTLTGGAGLAIDTTYYVSATSLAASTFRVSAAASPDTPLGFSTNITAGTVTADFFDPPTDNYDLTLIDADGFDRLNSVGVDRDTANTERAAVTGVPYIAQGEVTSLTFANNSVKCGAVEITVTYTPYFL